MPGLRNWLRLLLAIKLKSCFQGFIFIIILTIAIIFCISIKLSKDIENDIELVTAAKNDNGGYPIILWWTPFTGDNGSVKQCDSRKCYITNNREYYVHQDLKGMLFYGSSLTPEDMPPPWSNIKKPRPPWALLHEESAKNMPLLQHNAALSLFNFSSTFSRYSDFPLTLQHLRSKEDLIGSKFFLTTAEKNSLQLQQSLAPAVFVQTDCDTPSEREKYVAELMQYMPIDSYGLCLQNKKLPDHLQDAMEGMHHNDFWKLAAQYKFTIAFENAVCEDYITEKLWRPLILGSVPVYYGSPTVKDWLPNNNSIINIRDFKTPEDLASYILMINKNDTLYETFLNHKLGKKKIVNTNLITLMDSRTWGTDSEHFETRNFVEEFECFICKQIHLKRNDSVELKTVTTDHYKCPAPVSPLTGKENPDNWWLEQWYQGKAEAQVLRKHILENKTLTKEHFYKEVGKCIHNSENCN